MRVAVVFGGRSAEHEISLGSARFVMRSLDPSKYEPVPVGILPNGSWMIPDDVEAVLSGGLEGAAGKAVFLLPDPAHKCLLREDGERLSIDFAFPVLHGTFGEDGAVQGLFEMADVPYAGGGVLASALGMDKELMKDAYAAHGLPQAAFVAVRDVGGAIEAAVRTVEAGLDYPMIIKPANLGSSVGMSSARDRPELEEALRLAFRYDRKAVVEKLLDIRNLEVAILGNEQPQASVVGEVASAKGWLDFEAKYADGMSQILIPAPLDEATSEEVRRLALEAYQIVDCAGFARMDLLLERGTGKPFVSEINTLPGMSEHSTFPLLWKASGVEAPQLFDRIVELGLARFAQRRALLTRR